MPCYLICALLHCYFQWCYCHCITLTGIVVASITVIAIISCDLWIWSNLMTWCSRWLQTEGTSDWWKVMHNYKQSIYMGVSKNRGTPKSSILIGFSIINHPFWGIPIFWKHPYIVMWVLLGWSFSWEDSTFRQLFQCGFVTFWMDPCIPAATHIISLQVTERSLP